MSEIDHIVSGVYGGLVLKPEILSDMDFNLIIENLKNVGSQNTYFLLPYKYGNLDLSNSTSKENKIDSILIFLMVFVKKLVDNNLSASIIFDSALDMRRLQSIGRSTQFSEVSNGFISTGPFVNFRFSRQNEMPYATYEFRNGRVRYPANVKNISLLLQTDDINAQKSDLIIYVKRKDQFFRSGFPKFSSPEYKLNSIKTQTIPILTIITNTTSLTRYLSDADFAYLHAKAYKPKSLNFKEKSWQGYYNFKETDKKIIDIFNDINDVFGKLYFCAGILFTLYSNTELQRNQINDSFFIRMTENLTLRGRIKDVFEELSSYVAELGSLTPKITSWLDIYTIRQQIEYEVPELTYPKQLEGALELVIKYMFSDVLTYNKLFSLSKGISDDRIDFEEIRKKTSNLVEELSLKERLEEVKKDFDPESALGYLGSEYNVSEDKKLDTKELLSAYYFVLDAMNEKYIFYCQLGKTSTVKVAGSTKKKSLDELRVGDVIEKKYWNYQLLKLKIMELIDSGSGKIEDADNLIKLIEESDAYRQFLEKYAFHVSSYGLNVKFEQFTNSNVRNLLRSWSLETMCPRKKEMFIAVAEQINYWFDTSFDGSTILEKFRRIRRYKRIASTKEDTNAIVGYKIIEGPIKVTVEAEKLGRIYRLS